MVTKFNFDPIDKPRLTAILSTFDSSSLLSEEKEYSNFIQCLNQLRQIIVKYSLRSCCDQSFNYGEIDYKLTEIFASQLSLNTESVDLKLKQYYQPVFDLFECCKFSIDSHLFIKVCQDLNLTIYISHFKHYYRLEYQLFDDQFEDQSFRTLWNAINDCNQMFMEKSDKLQVSKQKMFDNIKHYVLKHPNQNDVVERIIIIAINIGNTENSIAHSNDEWIRNFIIWFIEFVICDIDQFHSLEILKFIEHLEMDIDDLDKCVENIKLNQFWKIYFQSTQNINNINVIFQLISSDAFQSYSKLYNQLFNLFIISIVYQNIEDTSLLSQLFAERVANFSLNSIDHKHQTNVTLDKKFSDIKIKFDSKNFWKNAFVRQITFKIIYETFINPETAINQLMDQLVMSNSELLNRYLTHLFVNQFNPIITLGSNEQIENSMDSHENLGILLKIIMEIIISKCNIIQINHFKNILNNFQKCNLIDIETLFTNLLLCFPQSFTSVSHQLEFLKFFQKLFTSGPSNWSGKNFILIFAYLIELLLSSNHWNQPIQKEILCDIIEIYLDNVSIDLDKKSINTLYTLFHHKFINDNEKLTIFKAIMNENLLIKNKMILNS